MIDTEVQRLRRLRNMALSARALALALEPGHGSLPPRAALACWLVARIVTGRLRAHPHFPYHRGPGRVRAAYERVSAAMRGAIAAHRGGGLAMLGGELRELAGELADARAVTWSTELGDAFGRSHDQLEKLLEEADSSARSEARTRRTDGSEDLVVAAGGGNRGGNVPATWPYLAL